MSRFPSSSHRRPITRRTEAAPVTQRSTSLNCVPSDSASMSDPGGWRALHIHLPPSVQSEYLADVILPSMSALMPEHDYFFLRYWQGGSHLRLRLRSTPERPLDDEAINESKACKAARSPLKSFSGGHGSVSALHVQERR